MTINLVISKNIQLWDIAKKTCLWGNGAMTKKSITNTFDLLDYHWSDENKIEEDIKKIKKIYEAIIPKLSQILNEINGRNYSKEFWELLIYRWTSLFY